ncbi:hypothetical protein MmiEs2_04030 [Methanimicrococcus stummii]|uniref:Uncharacterized protein n=1 Tax=Methanimicrococcus stummii TaxID=3028294 RepID=A0AA96ZWU9_9EURY|nr:protease inhibitor I42 family protein [Methanimicrococcus sp. Es2]WNY28219.1 hypothetical protein MmiEs2_04030 [Methanimicrococcus sp. Es2]
MKICFIIYFTTISMLVILSGCLTNTDDSNELEESPSFQKSFRLAQFMGDSILRFSFSENITTEYWVVEENPEGIVNFENWGTTVPETPVESKWEGSMDGTHVWEFYPNETGTVKLNFNLIDSSSNNVQESITYTLTIDNKTMKLILIQQLKTSKTLLEKKLEIEENQTLNISFQEYSHSNKRWNLEIFEDSNNTLEKINDEVIISETQDELNVHRWIFEGKTSGYIQLKFTMMSDDYIAEEIVYDIHVSENKTINVINSNYYIFEKNII